MLTVVSLVDCREKYIQLRITQAAAIVIGIILTDFHISFGSFKISLFKNLSGQIAYRHVFFGCPSDVGNNRDCKIFFIVLLIAGGIIGICQNGCKNGVLTVARTVIFQFLFKQIDCPVYFTFLNIARCHVGEVIERIQIAHSYQRVGVEFAHFLSTPTRIAMGNILSLILI